VRLAVLLGGPNLCLAEADQRLGLPRSLPPPPVGQQAEVAVHAVLGGSPATELVVVHPSHWSPTRVRAALEPLLPLARRVVSCPSALAVAREVDARSPRPPGPLAVLEIDPAGVGITLLADPAGGAVLASRFGPGASSPAELLAEAADAIGRSAAELTGGVLLAGDGPALRPEGRLAELIDLAGQRPIRVEEPAELAALGGLRAPRWRIPAGPALSPRPMAPKAVLGAGLIADPPPPRLLRSLLLGVGLPVLCALVTILGTHPPTMLRTLTGRPGEDPVSQAERGGVLAQYDYALLLPAGWRQSGGLPTRRRTLLSPVGTPNGSDLISIEQTLLGYDSAAEPDRAYREFQSRFAEARAGGADLDDFTPSTILGGRDVLAYRQHQPLRHTDVDWYVLFAGDSELSLGCQHTSGGAAQVRIACAQVLATLRIRGR
jgi:type VII secretion-associated protein (TIGR03931 family)